MLARYPEPGTDGYFRASKPTPETKPAAERTAPVAAEDRPQATKKDSPRSEKAARQTEPRPISAETVHNQETKTESGYPAWFVERYKPEQIERAKRLGEMMQEAAARQNNQLKKECGVKFDLLNKYGAIDARIFAANNGGPIPDTIAQKDKAYVEATERALADVGLTPADRTPEVEERETKALLANRRARMERYKISPDEDARDPAAVDRKLLEGFRLERAMAESFQLEKAFVITFAKLIGPDYVVCRSADYDDYKGVDTLIMDTKTGQVVCALDEVFDKYPDNARRNGNENERVRQKISTTENTNRKGGKRIEYGARIYEKDGRKKLVREPIEHVPLFYVAITKAELDSVIAAYADGTDPANASEAELSFFKTVLDSWREQISAIPDQKAGARPRPGEHPIVKKQLEKSFLAMETLAKRFEKKSA